MPSQDPVLTLAACALRFAELAVQLQTAAVAATAADPAPAGNAPPEPAAPGRSGRMREVLECVLRGRSEKEIAHDLGVSSHTVHCYMKRLYRQFAVNTRAELMSRWIVRAPVLQPPVNVTAAGLQGFQGAPQAARRVLPRRRLRTGRTREPG